VTGRAGAVNFLGRPRRGASCPTVLFLTICYFYENNAFRS
jgi:hypothetical protein